jgi:hypothetical protein
MFYKENKKSVIDYVNSDDVLWRKVLELCDSSEFITVEKLVHECGKLQDTKEAFSLQHSQ